VPLFSITYGTLNFKIFPECGKSVVIEMRWIAEKHIIIKILSWTFEVKKAPLYVSDR
jgi:hypothetical protein